FRNCKAKTAFWLSMVIFIIAPVLNWYVTSIAGPGNVKIIASYFYLYKSHSLLNVLWFGLIGSFKGMVLNLHFAVVINAVMLGCFLLGFAAHKSNFFCDLLANKKSVIKIWTSCLIGFFVLEGTDLFFPISPNIKKYYNIDYLIIIITM